MKLSAWITDELIHSGWVDEKERALYEYSRKNLVYVFYIVCWCLSCLYLALVDCIEKPMTAEKKNRYRHETRIILLIIIALEAIVVWRRSRLFFLEITFILLYGMVCLIVEKVRKHLIY